MLSRGCVDRRASRYGTSFSLGTSMLRILTEYQTLSSSPLACKATSLGMISRATVEVGEAVTEVEDMLEEYTEVVRVME